MRSYKLTVGIKKANGKDKDSYAGAIIFSSASDVYDRLEHVTFVWNKDTSLYETTIPFNDKQYSSVAVLLETAPGIASSSLWQFGLNTASCKAFIEESETTYSTTPFLS